MNKTIREKLEKVRLRQTNSIQLSYEYVTYEIFNEISKLSHLRELKLIGCNLTDIPDSISNLVYLEILDIQDWSLEKLPLVITKLYSLKTLSIRGNQYLKTLPDELANLTELEMLDISDTGFEVIPNVLSSLEKLKILKLSYTYAKNYSILKKIETLEELYLFNNVNPELISQISVLKNLKILSLACNSEYPDPDYYLENFPDKLFDLINLEKLDLSNNRISSLPSEVKKLNKLKEIDFQGNNFNLFPVQLLELINLEKIDFSNNNLSDLPSGINKLKSLFSINLAGNGFTQFPRRICELDNLEKINLSQNPLTQTAMLFFYNLLDKNFLAFFKSENTRIDASILNFESLGFKVFFGENFAYLHGESIENEVFIEFQNYSNQYDEIGDFHEEETFFYIHILGNEDTRKYTLKKICKRIDEWLHKQGNHPKIAKFSRSFRFRTKDINQNGHILIEYEMLIELGKARKDMYFHSHSKKNIPVKDLLEYIGIDENDLKQLREKKEWKGTSFLTKIKIENFKLFNHLEFTLSEHFNIILGRNGLGKTSILQAVAFGLLPLNNVDKSNNFEDYIQFQKNKSEVLLSWGEEHKKAYIFKNELNEEEYINFPQKLILAYGVNLNTNPELDNSEIVGKILYGDALPYSTKSIFIDYSTNFHDPLIILEKLALERNEVNGNTIDSIIQLLGSTLNNYLELIEESGGIQLEGNAINFYSKKNLNTGKYGKMDPTRGGRVGQVPLPNKARGGRVVPISLPNKARGGRLQGVNSSKETNFYFVDINGNQLKTRHLSEGYRDHILLVTDILIRILAARNEIFGKDEVEVTESFFKEVNGVILIDEFDRHLHPVWQRKLLSRFKEDFPKMQFILTTHNPFSVQSAVGANAIELIVEDKTIKTVSKAIESRNILSIIREYFTKDFFDYETQEQMKQFSKYLDEIDEGNTDLAYSQEFKNLVVSISEKSDELKSIIGSQLLQLNATLKKINRKEFEL